MPYKTPISITASLCPAPRARGSNRAQGLQKTRLACALGLLLLGPVTTFALELGDASIKSGLGQSLRVEIPYRLAANETLTPICVGLVPPPNAARELPTYTQASRVSISSTHIEIVGDARVLEPLIGLNVEVRCSTTPRLVRSYQLFVDPPAQLPTTRYSATGRVVPAPVAIAEPSASLAAIASAASSPPASAQHPGAADASPSPRARGQTGEMLSQGQTYHVVRGDTLSGIAARVADRTSIRDAADAIFAANPQAFRRGNRDLLEEGRSITIPVMASASAEVPAVAPRVPPGEVRSVESITTTSAAPAVELPPALPNAAPEPRAADISTAAVPPTAERPVETVTAAEPSAVAPPATQSSNAMASTASPTTSGSASTWLTIVLAFGAGVLVSIPFRLIRRRKLQVAVDVEPKTHGSRPQRLADPAEGIVVVEAARSPTQVLAAVSTATSSANVARADSAMEQPARLDDLASSIGPVSSVDLDIGAPLMSDDRANEASNAPSGLESSEETAATARMPSMDSVAPLQPRASKSDVAHRTVANHDDEMTMTIAELDMLRQDYEAEHTMTQGTSKALRDALADLKATQAARAANAEAATMEIPEQSDDAPTESLQTAKLRAAR